MDIVYEYLYEADDDYNHYNYQQYTAPTLRLRTIAAIELTQIAIEILDELKISQLGDEELEDDHRKQLLEEYSQEEFEEWVEEHIYWQEREEQKRKYLEVLRLTPSIFHAAVKEEIFT
ncbi:hypothetical protein LCGC14_0175100 [marine sediment metagenome]|uniref:Uncharacterized protein n=1 Tax=marine sediment metagenome TaxID=412755 RepID=A0A0F9X9I2_9ZZZZ